LPLFFFSIIHSVCAQSPSKHYLEQTGINIPGADENRKDFQNILEKERTNLTSRLSKKIKTNNKIKLFEKPKSEARKLYKLYRKYQKKVLGSDSLNIRQINPNNYDEKDALKLIQHISNTKDELTKKEFIDEYDHLAKFAEKYSSLESSKLIEKVIEERQKEFDVLKNQLNHDKWVNVIPDSFDENNIDNLTRQILQNTDFQQLSNQEKNQLIKTVNELKSLDRISLQTYLKKGENEQLRKIFNNKESEDNSVIESLKSIDINRIKEDISAFKSGDIQGLNTISGQRDINQMFRTEINDLPQLSNDILKQELLNSIAEESKQYKDSLEQYTKYLEKVKEYEDKEVPEFEEVQLQEKEQGVLPGNTYIDFIVGYVQGEYSVLNLSPNFGCKFNSYFSAGLGVTFQHTFDDKAYISSVLGYKIFGKYEFFQKRLFLTVENVFLIPGISYFNPPEGAGQFEFTTLVGAGYALNIFKQKILTVSVNYNFNDEMSAPALTSPWLMRFGINIF
jgi:hypothetical protein